MRVARYWARARGQLVDGNGQRCERSAWGWSATSRDDALANARKRIEVLTDRLSRKEPLDHYPYATNPRREEIVQELGVPDSSSHAYISRNRYGALILNTAELPFVDVDCAPSSWLSRVMRRIRGGEPPADEALTRIRQAAEKRPGQSFRIYRTAAGFRVLGTDLLLDPTGSEAAELLKAFGSDPRFATLCRIQASFRARLTPKPWRIDHPLPRGQYPFTEPEQERAHARWVQRYEELSEGYATCRLVDSLGPSTVIEEASEIVDAHDTTARVGRNLPLA
jgi:hypothetical protein